MKKHRPLLVEILLQPSLSGGLSLTQWDLLVRQARRAKLLARLARRLEGLAVPEPVRPHLAGARLLAGRQGEATQRELAHIRRALGSASGPIVLLKGAAYLMAGLQAAQGRFFSDIDLLVPRAQLPPIETALMVHGWAYGELDAYDSRYYHQWMHELPPLTHTRRGTALDVHHTLLPPIARIKINTPALFENLMPLADQSRSAGLAMLYVLPPADMLLHSAAHLFHEGEFDNGLRDLFDLDALLRQFGTDAAFWPHLLARAQRIGLQRPLHHALRYTSQLLGTPVPDEVIRQLARLPGATPRPLSQRLLDLCFHRALLPRHASCDRPGSRPALAALYLRSHWLRMPAVLLASHLARKQIKRWLEARPSASGQA